MRILSDAASFKTLGNRVLIPQLHNKFKHSLEHFDSFFVYII